MTVAIPSASRLRVSFITSFAVNIYLKTSPSAGSGNIVLVLFLRQICIFFCKNSQHSTVCDAPHLEDKNREHNGELKCRRQPACELLAAQRASEECQRPVDRTRGRLVHMPRWSDRREYAPEDQMATSTSFPSHGAASCAVRQGGVFSRFLLREVDLPSDACLIVALRHDTAHTGLHRCPDREVARSHQDHSSDSRTRRRWSPC